MTDPERAVIPDAVRKAAHDAFWAPGSLPFVGLGDVDYNNRLDAALSAALPLMAGRGATTPAARWRENGAPDPHGDHYDGERAALCGGNLSDDEVANEVFLNPSIGNLTAAKDRIRWLSRRLSAHVPIPDAGKAEGNAAVARFEFDRYVNGVLMAEGVTIERETDLLGAVRKAAQIASRGPNREVPVLVLREAEGNAAVAGGWQPLPAALHPANGEGR